VSSEVAMTGEITLRGRVLPIGGLKEKALAAHRAGIRKVLFPKENERDMEEIPESVREALEFVPVTHMDEVLGHALADPLPDRPVPRYSENGPMDPQPAGPQPALDPGVDEAEGTPPLGAH